MRLDFINNAPHAISFLVNSKGGKQLPIEVTRPSWWPEDLGSGSTKLAPSIFDDAQK